ncbi:MAG: hypothetical protein C4310_05460, partial [Chloroflexota bacterium]
MEQIGDKALGFGLHTDQAVVIIQVALEEIFELGVFGRQIGRKGDQVVSQRLHLLWAAHAALVDALCGLIDQVGDLQADQATDEAIAHQVIKVAAIPAEATFEVVPQGQFLQ